MGNNAVFRKNGRDGKKYLAQAYGSGYVSIEIDENDAEMSLLVEDALKTNDLSRVLKYRRDKKQA